MTIILFFEQHLGCCIHWPKLSHLMMKQSI